MFGEIPIAAIGLVEPLVVLPTSGEMSSVRPRGSNLQQYYPAPWAGKSFLFVRDQSSSTQAVGIFSFNLNDASPLGPSTAAESELAFNLAGCDSADPAAGDSTQTLVFYTSHRVPNNGGCEESQPYSLYAGVNNNPRLQRPFLCPYSIRESMRERTISVRRMRPTTERMVCCHYEEANCGVCRICIGTIGGSEYTGVVLPEVDNVFISH